MSPWKKMVVNLCAQVYLLCYWLRVLERSTAFFYFSQTLLALLALWLFSVLGFVYPPFSLF